MSIEPNTPAWQRIVNDLRSKIEDLTYPSGSLLPSEAELCSAFGTSRTTIIKALSALRADGWIESHQGKGHVSRGKPANYSRVLVDEVDGILTVTVRSESGKPLAVVQVPVAE